MKTLMIMGLSNAQSVIVKYSHTGNQDIMELEQPVMYVGLIGKNPKDLKNFMFA